jgi:hypothetical protein
MTHTLLLLTALFLSAKTFLKKLYMYNNNNNFKNKITKRWEKKKKKEKEKETVENKGAFLLVVFYCHPIDYPTETMV